MNPSRYLSYNCAMPFWEKVEILRKEQNTSYRWIASQMGVSETTVSSMRKSGTEPRAGDAVKIARALGTTVEFLAGQEKDDIFIKYRNLKLAVQEVLNRF